MHDRTKEVVYRSLVHARKECRACTGLVNPSSCRGGKFDCDEIGAWSAWQGNLDAPVLVVGQDWGDVDWFVREGGKSTNTSVTNTTLVKLLHVAGFDVSLARDSTGRGALFFTNAILCLKGGGAQAGVHREWFQNCGTRFLRPLIDLVRPMVVVGLGERAYAAVLNSYGLTPGPFRAAVAAEQPVELSPGMVAFAVYHCAARIQNTHRPFEAQISDWKRIAVFQAHRAG